MYRRLTSAVNLVICQNSTLRSVSHTASTYVSVGGWYCLTEALYKDWRHAATVKCLNAMRWRETWRHGSIFIKRRGWKRTWEASHGRGPRLFVGDGPGQESRKSEQGTEHSIAYPNVGPADRHRKIQLLLTLLSTVFRDKGVFFLTGVERHQQLTATLCNILDANDRKDGETTVENGVCPPRRGH